VVSAPLCGIAFAVVIMQVTRGVPSIIRPPVTARFSGLSSWSTPHHCEAQGAVHRQKPALSVFICLTRLAASFRIFCLRL
jgi:hypothetical protein